MWLVANWCMRVVRLDKRLGSVMRCDAMLQLHAAGAERGESSRYNLDHPIRQLMRSTREGLTTGVEFSTPVRFSHINGVEPFLKSRNESLGKSK